MSMKLTCGEFVGLAYASEDELREFTEEILDENAKLRAERDHMWALRDTWQENDAKLREENERLRSVVSDGADNARELRAEDTKLREQLDAAEHNQVRNAREYARLCHENGRLRALVRTLYMCSNIRCDHCEYGHGNTCAFDDEAELSERGIEVPE